MIISALSFGKSSDDLPKVVKEDPPPPKKKGRADDNPSCALRTGWRENKDGKLVPPNAIHA